VIQALLGKDEEDPRLLDQHSHLASALRHLNPRSPATLRRHHDRSPIVVALVIYFNT
jgi:hypothetical protein